MEPTKLPNFFDESIKIISFCPVCNAKYNPLEARILEEKDDAHLIHIKCRRCQSCVVALILTSNLGISSMGIVTDLTSEDVIKFKTAKVIDADDVINIHQLLESGAEILISN
ncbi:hypothetical protein C4569_01920 [Candidatus Parcubacteria bacterium]|nr:MAG: hypothetical protein C4569_01920 [Candidatus Parcubacteria bacterium]